MAERIELTDPQDTAFSKIAQGALVRRIVLPSGLKTPDKDMFISGTTLIETDDRYPPYKPKE